MAEDSCANQGCGCNTTSIYTNNQCPDCGRRLRVTGNLQQIKLKFSCPECGYQSPQLSLEEVREIMD